MKTTLRTNRRTGFVSQLGSLLLWLAVGLLLGLGAWYLLAKYLEVWRYDQTLVSTGFLLTLAVLGYATQEIVQRLGGWFRPPADDAVQPRGNRWVQALKALLGAVVLPLLALVIANQVSWSGTAPAFVPPPNSEYQYAAQVADAVLASHTPATKIAGIEALQALPPKDGAPMLSKLFDQDATILNDAGTYAALATALAADGTESKAWLLHTFAAHPPAAGTGAGATMDGGLYSYYFQQPFVALRQDLTNATANPAAQAALQLDLTVSEAQLQSSLNAFETTQTGLARGALVQDFVLEAFGQMSLSDDPDIYRLARSVAGDPAYPVDVRQRALGLVGKFGSSKDFDFLLTSLPDKDEATRGAALTAIKTLYAKTHSLK
jgi:hypothetical protein